MYIGVYAWVQIRVRLVPLKVTYAMNNHLHRHFKAVGDIHTADHSTPYYSVQGTNIICGVITESQAVWFNIVYIKKVKAVLSPPIAP